MSVFRAGLALAVSALLAAASPALAHQGSPNYLSQVRSIAPALQGLSVNVLNRDDRLAIQNTSGRTVVVQGYSHDPYLRLGGDGSVAVNTHSPAYYLNNDRYANAKVPAGAKATATPQWKPVSKTGRYEWHDHRMHYMGTGRPATSGTRPCVRRSSTGRCRSRSTAARVDQRAAAVDAARRARAPARRDLRVRGARDRGLHRRGRGAAAAVVSAAPKEAW